VRVFSNEAVKQAGSPLSPKSSYLTVIEGYPFFSKWLFYRYWLVYSVKTVAERHRDAAYHNKPY